MYLAQLSTLQTQAPFYISTLENIVKGTENVERRNNIDLAISEAIDVAKGEKNIFSIDNNHYFFVTKLLSEYKDKLLRIEKNNQFQTPIYTEILQILK